MPKFQVVNRKRKNSNDCQLERMEIITFFVVVFLCNSASKDNFGGKS